MSTSEATALRRPTSYPSPPTPTPGLALGHAASALVVGLAAAGIAAALRLVVPVHGGVAVAAAALLAVVPPTARTLSRRILLNGSVLLGLVPLLWWVRLPLGSLGRDGAVLSVLVGGTAAWLVARGPGEVRRRIRALLPTVAPPDAVPPLAAGVAATVVSGWLRVRTGSAALAALLPGWDNSAHLDMVEMLLRHGVTVDRLGAAPSGGTWQFADYPQGYHAVVATLVELTARSLADPSATLVAYLHAEAWVVVLLGGLLAAGVCSLPALRRRPALALPAAALVVAGFVTGPGATAFAGGFPNFVFACALAACIPLVVATTPRVVMPVHLAAIGALLVGVANAWILLLAVAVPAAAVLAFPATRSRWRGSWRHWLAASGVLLVTAFGVFAPLRVLSTLSAAAVLTTPGGIAAPEIGFAVSVPLGAAALCLCGPPARPRGRAWHAVPPLVGLVAAAAVGAWQLHATGELSYYFYKLLVGVELTGLAVAVVGLTGLVPAARARTGGGRRAVAVLVATAAAAQVSGFTLTGVGQFRATSQATAPMSSVVPAAMHTTGAPQTLVLDAAPADQLHAQQWFLALTGRWTTQANDAATRTLLGGAGGTAVVGAVLDQEGDAIALVEPAQLDEARRVAGPDRWARVISW